MVFLTCSMFFLHRLWCLLNFPNVSLLSVHDCDMYLQIRNQKYMLLLTKIDIRSRNKVDTENHDPCFSMLQLKRSWDKRMFFFFYNQVSFPFSSSCTRFMGMSKKTEYSPICKVSTGFLITRIPYFTVQSFQREKSILWLLW